MMLIAFPGAGWAGSVAAYYLIETLKLRWIASITSPKFPPIAVIKDGVPRPGIAIYSGPVACSVDARCGKLVVVTAEFVPHPTTTAMLSRSIFDWAKKKRIKEIITIESVAQTGEGKDSDVRVISTTKAREDIKRLGLVPLDDGLLSGFAGQLSVEAQLCGFRAITLMIEAQEGFPDAHAAARILEIIGPLMPSLEIDPKPLFERAKEIEEEMHTKNLASKKALSRLSREADFMFG
jgi:predicted ATP-grasp superfamily ATP-dependent carboligase